MRPSWQGTRWQIPSSSSIGSSAGGIEALSRVVGSLPPDFPAPIVIAQHLDPRRPSHLGEILARHATLPIKVVEEAASLEDGVIFVVPSNRLVEIVDGELRLRPAKPGSIAPSVDLLLETAAAAFGPGLIAVILTGSGSDGSAGAWQVKQAGGDRRHREPGHGAVPLDAAARSPRRSSTRRPTSIRSAACCGTCSPPTAPRRTVARRVSSRRCSTGSANAAGSTSARTRTRRSSAGCAAGWVRPAIASLADYAKQLDSDPEEYAKLISSLLIKVTEFFRDPKVFDHLRTTTLPMLIEEARRGRPPAAGLVGRLLDRRGSVFARDHRSWRRSVNVPGPSTCASSRPTSTATPSPSPGAGSIRRRRSRRCHRTIRDRYFVKSDGGYEVAKSVRALMTFGEHDLGARAPFPRIDLILCRNVLIYFSTPMQRAALETFGFSLRDDGRLVLGPSETVAAMPTPYRRGPRPAADLPPPPRPSSPCRWRRTKPVAPAPRARGPARRGDPLHASRRPGRGRIDRGGGGRCCSTCALGVVVVDAALLHHAHQYGRPADARDPRPGVRPGLHPPCRIAAVDGRAGRYRCRPRRGDDGRRSTRSRPTMSRPAMPGSSRRSCGRTFDRPA